MLKDNVERAKKGGKRHFLLRLGTTAEGITKVANDESVDFIIIGSTGLSSENKQTESPGQCCKTCFRTGRAPL